MESRSANHSKYINGLDEYYGFNKQYFDYTSGMIYSNYKFDYGMFEIKCKIPKGKGFWPAFWMAGASAPSWRVRNY